MPSPVPQIIERAQDVQNARIWQGNPNGVVYGEPGWTCQDWTNGVLYVCETLGLNGWARAVTVPAYNMLQNLLGHWTLSDNGNDSLNITNLTAVNDPVFSDGGVTLDGSNWLTSDTHFDLASGFTVSAWVAAMPSNISPAVSQWLGGAGGFRIGADSFPSDAFVGSVSGCGQVNALYTTDYVMLTLVYDIQSGISRLYQNNAQSGAFFNAPFIDENAATFKIGTLDAGGEFTYTGFINNVAIWSRSFNTDQITALYNNGTPLPFSQYGTTTA